MPAVTEKAQKAYWPLIEYLVNLDGPVYVADIPKNIGGEKLVANMNSAWIDGMIEFGRRHYTTTGVSSPDSIKHAERTIPETTMSWTGHKRNVHKPLRDLLKEDDVLPANVVEIVQDKDQQGNPVFKPVAVKSELLRLQVRTTDKCFAEMAA